MLLLSWYAITCSKQCLLVYHNHHISFLCTLYWSLSTSLPPLLSAESTLIRAKLSPHEADYLRSYHGIVQPPKDLHVLVHVV
ncbi:hypothetical protein B0H14DRAFT_3474734 [Mycena olivaceomarginata]|nr:hypothetical protein B0H14DRAFT_3474734 [Mycena olivaceomarginata]